MRDLPFRFGAWQVDPLTNSVERDGVRRRIEPLAMDVLVALCQRAGQLVSADELLQLCWGGTPYGDNPLHKTITQIRAALGDTARNSQFVETVRMRGYRTVADVSYPPPALVAQSWLDKSPFRGLQAFEEAHEQVFFGRGSAIAQCLAAVAAGVKAGNAMTLVLGPSGSGKTSLLQAGVLPALQRGVAGSAEFRVVSSTSFDFAEVNGLAPLTILASALLDWQPGHGDLWRDASSQALGARLRLDLPAVIAELDAALGVAPGARLALLVDRFEVFFADLRIGEEDRRHLLAVLDGLARSGRVLVLLACRNDFYPRLVQYQELMECKAHGGHFDLRPPSRSDIAQMIRGPAQAARLRLGVDAAGTGLEEVLSESAAGNPDFLPLLQYTLQELYRLRGADGELGFAALQQLGGVDGAIGQRAEEVVRALTKAQRAALPRVLSLLVTLSESGDTIVSNRSAWSSLRGPAEHELVSAMVESRLFVAELVEDKPGFGVAHEALLRRWPRVTEWIQAHRSALQVRRRISVLAARWAREGRSADLLLPRGRQLDEARALVSAGSFELSADETALIDKSHRSARWRGRLAGTAVALIAGLAVAAAALGYSEAAAKQAAQARRAEAEGLMEFMLGEFANQLRPLARLDLLDSVSAKAMEYLSASQSDELTAASLAHRAKALQVIGEVRLARGAPQAAVEALMAARAILKGQAERQPQQRGVLVDLGINAFWLGQLYLAQSDLPQAGRFFQDYRDYADRVHQLDPTAVDAWIEQSYAHSALGALATKRGDSVAAGQEFARSITLKTQALARKPGDRGLTADLANSLSWAGLTSAARGDLEQAASLYARELALVHGLHQSMPNEALWTTRYANALHHQASIRRQRGDDQAALADFRLSQQLYQSILRAQPDNLDWQGSQIAAELQQQGMLAIKGERERAAAALRTLSERLAVLIAQDPKNVRWLELQGIARQSAAVAALDAGRHQDAGTHLLEALSHLQRVHGKNSADLDIRFELAQTYLTLSELETRRANADAARSACRQATQLVAQAAPGSTDFRLLDPWVKAQHCLGHGATARAAQNRLAEMGYRQTAYLQYLSKHSTGE